MTNADSSSSKTKARLKTFAADAVFLAGLSLVCWGVFKYSVPAGLIITGIALAILGRAITPTEKKKN